MSYVLWIGVGLAVFAAMLFVEQAPGRRLKRLLQELKPVRGKTRADIVAQLGPPTLMSDMPRGRTLYQWKAIGFQIGLLFDGEICEALTQERDAA